jgi:hypothetical protein
LTSGGNTEKFIPLLPNLRRPTTPIVSSGSRYWDQIANLSFPSPQAARSGEQRASSGTETTVSHA